MTSFDALSSLRDLNVKCVFGIARECTLVCLLLSKRRDVVLDATRRVFGVDC